MKYVVIDEKGNILISEKSEEVDTFLVREDGLYHLISIYGKYITHETFQVFNHKIYRIDSVIF